MLPSPAICRHRMSAASKADKKAGGLISAGPKNYLIMWDSYARFTAAIWSAMRIELTRLRGLALPVPTWSKAVP